MKQFLTITIFALTALVVFHSSAHAQNEALDISEQPICFNVINEAPYTVSGTINTNYFTRPDGIRARHSSNFRLNAGGSKNDQGFPADRLELCASGPFYPGRRLEIVIRTLIPIDSCKTRVDQGDVIIEGGRDEEGNTQTRLKCFE